MAGNDILGFIEWAREEIAGDNAAAAAPGWAWLMSGVLSCCRAHPRGVTSAILVAELFQAWYERQRFVRCSGNLARSHPVMESERRKRRLELELGNGVSIDTVLEKKFVALDATMEVVVLDIHVLPGTSTNVLTLGDMSSGNTIDHFLHTKFYDMVHGIIRKGRRIRMTGCRLRIASGSCTARLLPTEYLKDESDAVLLATQFFSDTFSSIQPGAAADFYLYARLESFTEVESNGDKKWRTMLLADRKGCRAALVLWNDQVSVADLFSEGSMLALERPLVRSDTPEMHFELGTCTRLYCVSSVDFDQQGTEHIETIAVGSQLARRAQGAADGNNFSLRVFAKDLRPKMFNLALYGTVSSVARQSFSAKCSKTFLLVIRDETGNIEIELRRDCWSFGELQPGQLVFVSGLTTFEDSDRRLKCSWAESADGSSFVNISRLTAILTSPCLHALVPVSQWHSASQVCRVRLRRVDLQIKRVHGLCGRCLVEEHGHQVCELCRSVCDQATLAFHVNVSVSDMLEASAARETCAVADGEAAFGLLQVSPELFCTWPEDEQAMYLFSLSGEEFLVSFFQDQSECLRIGSAMKCEC